MTKKQLNLGELVDLLKQVERDEQTTVMFDFCGLAPDKIRSYRGYYEQLSVDYREGITLLEPFISDLDLAIGQTYEGYKGGEFTMHRGTPLWVSPYGRAETTVITGIMKHYNTVILKTRYLKD
jgi:hypothetical protein